VSRFFWNDEPVGFTENDTVATALLHHGVSNFAVSKDGRPNSIFCGIGQCQSCLVRKENGESVEACLCSCIENERFYSSDSRGDAHEQ
jgi:aerobic-type carbon monoxide dehydrogenase small subunit (CoxS/CutS family)